MLTDPTVQYADTVWLPLPLDSQFHFIRPLPWRLKFASCSQAEFFEVCNNICRHPTAIETLTPGRYIKSCAISVLLMAMLFSTPEFNALQILIKSGRFDLREPLIFHQFDIPRGKWVLIAVNALGMALLIDIVNYNKAAADRCFLLMSSLLDAYLVSLDSDFFVMECTGLKEWFAFRVRGPIAFLVSCDCEYFSLWHYIRFNVSANYALLEMLCRIGFEQSSPVLTISYDILNFNNFGRMSVVTNVFDSIVIIVNSNKIIRTPNAPLEIELSRLYRMGLLFPERGNLSIILLRDLHYFPRKIAASSFRMCRQLFALGLFRQPDFNAKVDPQLSWARRCLYDGELSLYSPCIICCNGHLISTKECPVVAPLVREFLSCPLTLLQLARIEIRRLIGVRHFESRVDTLKPQLPPLVFRYISRADEMLTENPNECRSRVVK